jgi:AhpD family alkylhydroperoxidase
MQPRLNPVKVASEAYRVLAGVETYLARSSGLEPGLLDLVKVRVSQMNGCAFCMDTHIQGALARGETEQRLYELNAWREAPFYTEREQAALAWTEAVTTVSVGHVSDEAYEFARTQFGEGELVNLTLAVISINGWNRISIAFRAVPRERSSSRFPARQAE